MLLQLYIAPVTEHFETKYMNNNSGVWAIKNWLIRTLIRCAYIFFAALIAGMLLGLLLLRSACVIAASVTGFLLNSHGCTCAGSAYCVWRHLFIRTRPPFCILIVDLLVSIGLWPLTMP